MNLKEPNFKKELNEGGGIDGIHSGRRTSHVPLWQSFKKSPNIVGYCLALSSAILLYGYDLVIVGTVAAMPQFQ